MHASPLVQVNASEARQTVSDHVAMSTPKEFIAEAALADTFWGALFLISLLALQQGGAALVGSLAGGESSGMLLLQCGVAMTMGLALAGMFTDER